jgi:hypothetical protein
MDPLVRGRRKHHRLRRWRSPGGESRTRIPWPTIRPKRHEKSEFVNGCPELIRFCRMRYGMQNGHSFKIDEVCSATVFEKTT